MRMIDADALIESIKHGLWDWETVNGIESRTVLEQTIQDIRNEPTIDAEPVRHGRWTECEYENGINFHRCSVCGQLDMYQGIFTDSGDRGFIFYYKRQYCPNCGAKMDGEIT